MRSRNFRQIDFISTELFVLAFHIIVENIITYWKLEASEMTYYCDITSFYLFLIFSNKLSVSRWKKKYIRYPRFCSVNSVHINSMSNLPHGRGTRQANFIYFSNLFMWPTGCHFIYRLTCLGLHNFILQNISVEIRVLFFYKWEKLLFLYLYVTICYCYQYEYLKEIKLIYITWKKSVHDTL